MGNGGRIWISKPASVQQINRFVSCCLLDFRIQISFISYFRLQRFQLDYYQKLELGIVHFTFNVFNVAYDTEFAVIIIVNSWWESTSKSLSHSIYPFHGRGRQRERERRKIIKTIWFLWKWSDWCKLVQLRVFIIAWSIQWKNRLKTPFTDSKIFSIWKLNSQT